MGKAERDPLLAQLEKLVGNHSMPDVVAALLRLSRGYKERLKRERNSEYQGWESWETALRAAFIEAAGSEELDE